MKEIIEQTLYNPKRGLKFFIPSNTSWIKLLIFIETYKL